ncbi:hypothetical protein MHYP_G00016690 [Metynnis hypsauchen]
MWSINMAKNASTAGLMAPEDTTRFTEHGEAAAAVRKVPRLYTQRSERGATNSNGAQCVEDQLLSAVQGAGLSSSQPSSLVSLGLARSALQELSCQRQFSQCEPACLKLPYR